MSVVDILSKLVTPAMLDQITGLVGAPQSSLQTATKGAIPGVLAAILSGLQSKQGADAFAEVLARQDPSRLDDLGALLGQNPQAAATAIGDMLSSIVGGGRMEAFASKLKDYAGLQEGSAGSLLGLVGSLAMGTLAKSARDRGLDASGVLNLLGREEAMPGDFAKALQGAGLLDSVTDRVTLVPPAAAAPVKPAPAPPRPAATSAPVRTPAPPPGRPWWHCWWG